MSENPLQPPRLRTSTARPSSPGGRLAHQLRILSAHAQMPRLRRIPRAAGPGRLWLAAIRVTVAAVILLAVVGGAGATVLLIVHRIHAPAAPQVAPSLAPTIAEKHPRSHRSAERPTAARETPITAQPIPLAPTERRAPVTQSEPPRANRAFVQQPTPRPENAAPRNPATRALRSPGLEPTPAVAPAPSPAAIAEEATLLRQALAALRQGKDPNRALELLGVYTIRFPRGALAPEAAAARAQALLLTGDKRGALVVLDQLSLEQGDELRIVRGELRSLAGRCQEALADFESVLQQTAGVPPEERARALYGRASCRVRTGDPAGAEQDRQRYLRDYPQGPASQLLRSQP